MKILFTGHRGFLGRELIPKLVPDYEVVKFDGDLRDFDELSKFVSLNRIDGVIHAAVRGGRRLKADDYSVLEENLLVGVNVFRLVCRWCRFAVAQCTDDRGVFLMLGNGKRVCTFQRTFMDSQNSYLGSW